MVVYWDLAALWNFILDYLLLLGTLRVAGRPLRRLRIALGAAFGAAYSVAALALPLPPWTAAAALPVMTYLAFGRSARYVKLTLLFSLLACALGGGALLLGRLGGGMERLAYGIFCARLPWGVFFASSGAAYLLLTLVFRGGARHERADFVRAKITCGGKTVTLRLLRDTGNTLCDPLTGEGVPVIEKKSLAPIFSKGNIDFTADKSPTILRCRTVSGTETELAAFRCDRLAVDGRELGARLIAWTEEPFGGPYQGLWFDEEREDKKQYELEGTVG